VAGVGPAVRALLVQGGGVAVGEHEDAVAGAERRDDEGGGRDGRGGGEAKRVHGREDTGRRA
jgi:hypothetical protein